MLFSVKKVDSALYSYCNEEEETRSTYFIPV